MFAPLARPHVADGHGLAWGWPKCAGSADRGDSANAMCYGARCAVFWGSRNIESLPGPRATSRTEPSLVAWRVSEPPPVTRTAPRARQPVAGASTRIGCASRVAAIAAHFGDVVGHVDATRSQFPNFRMRFPHSPPRQKRERRPAPPLTMDNSMFASLVDARRVWPARAM